MPVMKFLVVTVILVLVVGGTLQYMGILHINNNGTAQLSAPNLGQVDDYTAADALFIQNKSDDTLIAYRKALEKDPNNTHAATAMFRIGKCLEDLGKNDEAITAYQAYVDKFPNDTDVRKANERIEYLKGAAGK